MIRVDELEYGVPSKELYKGISFTIERGEHCALIGVNGTGKSTLADIIINPDEYLFDGTVEKDDDCRIGYARQFSMEDKEKEQTAAEYLSERFIKVQDDIAKVCEEMAEAADMEEVFERYQKLLDLNESMDGDNYESNIHKALYTAGMLDLKEARICDLSGGEYKVLQIVKEMLLSPDLLVLDEPDAFLDFANIHSLCELINEYKGAMLVITHNRFLLNHCFNKILHLESGELQEYAGNYTEYRCQQLREKLELKRQYIAEQDEIERTEEMVEILRKRATLMVNPTIGRSVNAKQSHLDRLISRQIDAPVFEIKDADILLPEVEPEEERTVLSVSDYSVSFDEMLLEDVDFEIKSGEKVAIVGANGAGKTTLVRDIIRNDNPSIHMGENVKYAWLSQLVGESGILEKSIYEYLQDEGFGGEEEIRIYLSGYKMGDIVIHQSMGSLSIGEQNLIQIAAMAASDAEFLILDEPTSHLDIYTQTALENAIKEYKGTVLLISHDFYLISNCTDYVLLVEDNTIRRMRARKFRKMVYDRFFSHEYLEKDRKKQEIEAEIARAYRKDELDAMEKLIDQLEKVNME